MIGPITNPYPKHHPLQNGAIALSIGEHGDTFIRRNREMLNVDRQPAGLNFYELRWPSDAMGMVLIEQRTGKLPIEHVLSVTGTEDMEFPAEGLNSFSINSTLATTDTISHDDARMKTYSYLNRIVQSGWRVIIPRNVARVRGKHMTEFMLQSRKSTSLDPSYLPTMDEWMKFANLTEWAFYADHMFLTVQMTRERTLTDPSKPGAYLLTTELSNENGHFRGYVDGLDRPQWKKLLKHQVDRMSETRVLQEAEIRKKGIPIDERYVDPPLPDLEK